jgi:penicillin-binding protein 1A
MPPDPFAARRSNFFTRPFRRTAADFRDPERPVWKKLGLAFVLLFMAMTLPLLGVVAYSLLLIPSAPGGAELQRETAANPSIVRAADGSVLTQFERRNRITLPLDSISQPFLDALLVIEDRRFYEHKGVDFRRTVRAGMRTAGGRMEGGSTLTQQLARNLYPDDIGRSVSIRRKLMELIVARRIERSHTKDQILSAYVNTVPFLYNAFGVEMAARTYFDTHASELDAVQAATLVGMLKGTSLYNPVRNPDRARERRNLVLAQLARHGRIDPAELESLQARPLGLEFERQDGPGSENPHFTRYVREWLTAWADRHGYDLYTSGLTIHTTLDPAIQRLAEAAARQRGEQLQAVAEREWAGGDGRSFGAFWARHAGLERRLLRNTDAFREAVAAGRPEQAVLDSLRGNRPFADSIRAQMTRLEIGFVALEPRTGFVKAWVGSRDFSRTPYDHVWQARRQPGSTFKPFVYAAALRRGFLPGDTFVDEQVDIRIDRNRVWRPANAGGAYTGQPMTLTEGLAYSKNTVTAQLMMEVGPAYVAQLARDSGIRESRLEANPALALGTSEVTLLEMTAGYATFAAGGTYRPPVPVSRVEDMHGRVVAEFASAGERVVPQDVAQVLVHMMRGVIDRGTGRRIRAEFGVTKDVAGKTGTSQNGADGWFLMMHPDLVAGAWVGFPEPTVTFRTSQWGQGSRNALLVVGDFFRDAQGLISDARFETPARYQDPESIWSRARNWWDGMFADQEGPGQLPDLDDDLFQSGFEYEPADLEGLDPDAEVYSDRDPGLAALEAERRREEARERGEPVDEPEDDPAAATPDAPYEERSAVQRLYEREGQSLEQDVQRARQGQGSPPGQSGAAPGRSGQAPGQTGSPGNSGNAPGRSGGPNPAPAGGTPPPDGASEG